MRKFTFDTEQSALNTVHAQFEAYVKQLERTMRVDSQELRLQSVDELLVAYEQSVGTLPPSPLITRLSHVILADDLYDRAHKAKNKLEYSFVNERELKRATDEGRRVSLDNFAGVAIDGRDYSLPLRKIRRESSS